MTASIENFEELASFLEQQKKKARPGSLKHAALLLGLLTKNSEVKANIPDKDKSMFSLEKYKFFLDAPFEISSKCCDVMKKAPMHKYAKETGRKPITAQMASESRLRLHRWMQYGCNAFDSNAPISNPMSFWTDQDVLEYVYINGLPICSVYGDVVRDGGQLSLEDFGMDVPSTHHYRTTGCDRTGCMLCGFGCHLEKRGKGRFLRLKETHPGVYGLLDMVSNNGYTMRQAIGWTNENGNLHIEC